MRKKKIYATKTTDGDIIIASKAIRADLKAFTATLIVIGKNYDAIFDIVGQIKKDITAIRGMFEN